MSGRMVTVFGVVIAAGVTWAPGRGLLRRRTAMRRSAASFIAAGIPAERVVVQSVIGAKGACSVLRVRRRGPQTCPVIRTT
jgi:hypothetical protein